MYVVFYHMYAPLVSWYCLQVPSYEDYGNSSFSVSLQLPDTEYTWDFLQVCTSVPVIRLCTLLILGRPKSPLYTPHLSWSSFLLQGSQYAVMRYSGSSNGPISGVLQPLFGESQTPSSHGCSLSPYCQPSESKTEQAMNCVFMCMQLHHSGEITLLVEETLSQLRNPPLRMQFLMSLYPLSPTEAMLQSTFSWFSIWNAFAWLYSS